MPGKNVQKEESHALGNLKIIREILDLMNEQGISEFELENNGFRVRIKRGAGSHAGLEVQQPVTQPPHFSVAHAIPPLSHAVSEAGAVGQRAGPPESASDQHEGLHIIKSPIVGTFYGASAPDAPPFVKVGDVVHPGQVLCIIEAMKLMNEIEAEVAGEIARTFVENGQPVEYGQALFGVVLSNSQ